MSIPCPDLYTTHHLHNVLDAPDEAKIVHKILLIGTEDKKAKEFRKKYFKTGFKRDFGDILGADYAHHEFFIQKVSFNLILVHLSTKTKFHILRKRLVSDTKSAILLFNNDDPDKIKKVKTLIEEIDRENSEFLSILLVGTGNGQNDTEIQEFIEETYEDENYIVGYLQENQYTEGEIQLLIEKFFLPSMDR